jgi:hypothetical protein
MRGRKSDGSIWSDPVAVRPDNAFSSMSFFFFFFVRVFLNVLTKIIIQRELTLSVVSCVARECIFAIVISLLLLSIIHVWILMCAGTGDFCAAKGEKNSHGDFCSRGKARVVVIVALAAFI